jgi:hypothetical protein
MLMPTKPDVMPRDTTPAVVSPQRYRVLAKAFVNGALHHPENPDGSPNYVTADAGLASAALVPVDDAGNEIDTKAPAMADTKPPEKSARK